MIFLGVGSSIGDADEIFASATCFLGKSGICIIRKSEILKNAPYGGVAQNEFSNVVWGIEFDGSAYELLEILKVCEKEAGRDFETKKWSDRVLDLDILMFDDLVLNSEKLTIPHKEIAKRVFVLQPWIELMEDDFEVPNIGKLGNLLQNLKNQ